MTQDERNAAIGKLTQNYAENKRTIVALRTEVREVQSALGSLAAALNSPENVTPFEAGGSPGFQLKHGSVITPKGDSDKLSRLLAELHSALTSRKEIEKDLKEAGLENLVTP